MTISMNMNKWYTTKDSRSKFVWDIEVEKKILKNITLGFSLLRL